MATHFADEPTDDSAEAVLPEESDSSESTVEAAKEEAPAAPGPSARKAMASKEVIPFAWKLVGYSSGIPVTLFKSVERDDVELQLARVERDGYYKDLKVLDINIKVEQPKRAADPTESKSPAKKAAKPQGKTTLKKSSTEKVPVKKAASKEPKKTARKKATPKKAAPTAKKKKSAAAKSPKRKAKKR